MDPSLSPGRYQLRVIGRSASGEPVRRFGDAITLVLGPDPRPAITLPPDGAVVRRGSEVTFEWTAAEGARQYGFEFTGAGGAFANPNGTIPDEVNGLGGTGGGLAVSGTAFTVRVPETLAAGRYQVRVIALSAAGLPFGTFSDALTLVVE